MEHIKRSRGILFPLLAGVAMAALAGGCKQPDNATTDNTAAGGNVTPTDTTVGKAKPYDPNAKEIVIGEYGSLTGAEASFGANTRDGIAMAVAEANAAGGVLGKPIRIQLENDDSRQEQAATVVKKLVSQDNVLAVLGEVASSNSKAGAQVCQPAGVPMISPTSTNPEVTQIGDYIFRTCFIDPFQGTVNARFASKELKAKTAAVLTDIKSDYSVGLSKFFIEEFKKNGGQIVAEESYKKGDTEFRAQLNNIKTAKPQVVFIPGYYNDVGAIAKQARESGLDQPLLGGDGWDSPKLTEIGGEAIQGSYFSTHYAPQSKDPRVVKFVADYKKRYNEVPTALAAVAYDAARLLFAAIKKANTTDRAKIRDAIAATKDFPGVTGNITIDENRNAVKPLVMVQVKGDDFVYKSTVNP